HQRRAPWPRLPRRRCRHPPRRALRLASRARPLNDVLGALGALDRQLYLGIVDARNPLLAVLAIALTYLNYNGLIWWVGIVALARSWGRCPGWSRRTPSRSCAAVSTGAPSSSRTRIGTASGTSVSKATAHGWCR